MSGDARIRGIGIVALSVALTCIAGCGGADPRTEASRTSPPPRRTTPPPPPPTTHVPQRRVPPGAIAVVGRHPISKRQYRRFLRAECLKVEVLYPPEGRRRSQETPYPCSDKYEIAKGRALDEVITGHWYDLEARRQGVRVDPARLQRFYRRALAEGLQRGRMTFARYRRAGGLRKRDLYFVLRRLELPNLLSGVDMYGRYHPQTTCARGYVTESCGNSRPQ
jgi:hypothetical protein